MTTPPQEQEPDPVVIPGITTQSLMDAHPLLGRIWQESDTCVQQGLGGLLELACQPCELPTVEQIERDFGLIAWLLDRLDGAQLNEFGLLSSSAWQYLEEVSPGLRLHLGNEDSRMHWREIGFLINVLVRLGLLRRYQGQLLRTKRGSQALESPQDMFELVAQRLIPNRRTNFTYVASLMQLLSLESAPPRYRFEVAAGMATMAGWHTKGHEHVIQRGVMYAKNGPSYLFWLMGQPKDRYWESEVPSPTAVALARAALLMPM
ncbi:hypothetical protein V5R04_12705 [Jonesiaceae bacterium BS-20]|uniref:Uncharacterized protein n=1 Tax=Jonesiaceae bacterium BS-20 TaxID=3120821 RepID=A0AAU7DVH6_9MICO